MYNFVEIYKHHNNKFGIMIVFETKTDFAAKTDLVKDVTKFICTLACGYRCETIRDILAIESSPRGSVKEILSKTSEELGEPFEIIEVHTVYL